MKDAAKVVTEITFYFSALQNINLLFFIMFVSWQIPIACLQNFRARFRKMYTEWLLLTAEWCIFSYILLHIKCLITRIRLQSADHKKHEIQISHVFCIFPYFSEIFRNFPGNFPEIFRNIIFRKIYITMWVAGNTVWSHIHTNHTWALWVGASYHCHHHHHHHRLTSVVHATHGLDGFHN